MRVVGTFHPSSSVTRSLKCRLTPDLDHLVVAKTDKLEVFSLQPDGLRLECTMDMWGRVVGIQAIPAKNGRLHIMAMTDHPDPKLVVLSYESENDVSSLVSRNHLSLSDRTARQAEFVTDFQVDPTGTVVAASCYVGKIKVVTLKDGNLDNSFDASLPELNLLAFTFLHTEGRSSYALALLHLNHRRQLQLLCRTIDLSEYELSPTPSNLLIPTILSERTFPSLDPAPRLVPIPPYSVPGFNEGDEDSPVHRGGILVLGGKKVIFYEHASHDQQARRNGKQERLNKRLASEKQAEVEKAREKEKERDSRMAKPRARVEWPWAAITSWCSVESTCRRIIVGDTLGRLAMLAFDDSNMCLSLVPLGESSPATCLSYLSSQVLYIGSHLGDSQLVRIHPTPVGNLSDDTLPIPSGITTVSPSALHSDKGKGKATESELDSKGREGRIVDTKGTFLETIHRYDNIAPIMDAMLADIDESGQPQVITCSGAHNTGSLRIIRTEADFQEQARLDELPGITDIWPIKMRYEDEVHSHLVVSTLRGSLVFSFGDKETVAHLDPANTGFITNMPTFAVGNIPRRQVTPTGTRTTSSYVDSPLIVQVIPEGVQLIEYDQTLHGFSKTGHSWYPNTLGGDYTGREIVAAAMSPSQIIVGMSGGRLALLNLGQNDTLQLQRIRDFPDEICAVSCDPFDPSRKYATIIAVSFWGSNKVVLLALDSSEPLNSVCEVALPTLPSCVLLHNFGTGSRPKDADFRPHLLVGLADGTLVTYTLRDGTLHEGKQTTLGNAPASLSVCAIDERRVVLASATRASVLFLDRQRVRPSPVSVKHIVRGRTLNTAAFSSCLVIATPSAILIGNVRGVDKMQIRTIPFGLENPKKIAYHVARNVLGVACTRTHPARVGEFEDVKGSFKLLDSGTFRQLHTYSLDADEEPSALLALPTEGAGSSPAFVLGTVVVRPEEREPSRGRILLLSVSTAEGLRSVHVVASVQAKGCVYALARISENIIAAAVNTSVVFFRTRGNSAGASIPLTLEKVKEWNHNHFVTNLVWDGELLLVGDAISSVSVLKWTEESERLETVARDYGPLWPVSIEGTGTGIIGANSDCNLFSFSIQRGPLRSALEKDGVYNIDEVVNKFLRGRLTSADVAQNQAVKGTHVFFTSTGRIGVIMELDDSVALHMTALQRNMAKTMTGPGEVNHTKRRAPASQRGHTDAETSYGFLDGDFLETFLMQPSAQAERIVHGDIEAERITLPVERIKDVLMQMQSLH